MLNGMKRVMAGAALLMGLSATAQAQFLTDAGSPLGSGGGVSGSVVNYLAGVGGGSVGSMGKTFANINRGVAVAGPGGVVIVPQPTANALGQALSGNGQANVVSALTAAFGGTTQAGALAQAFATLGTTPTPEAARAVIIAYNAALDAAPAGPVPPGLLLARRVMELMGAQQAR